MSKHCVVQGASRGLGAAFVQALLARGDTVLATCREPTPSLPVHPRLSWTRLDVTDPASIEAAAQVASARLGTVHLLLNVSGQLARPGEVPEKKLEHVDPAALHAMFAVNAVGPLLVARAFLPLLKHAEPATLANLSARVGSIEDNHLGGWYGYRASKAAQNQLTRTLAVEVARRAKNLRVVALHPGTVNTDLSRPFHRNVPPHKLFTPERAATQLLEVLEGLGPEDHGAFFAWDGTRIPW
jgi:NAD(P)-dependent dehydrogenase (short-subunit alcohol dehydrogenase family)